MMLLDWLRAIWSPATFPEDGWAVSGIYNGLAHYRNGHRHRVAPAWWHLDIHPVEGMPSPNQCPKCDHHDEGTEWYATIGGTVGADRHVRRD